MRQKSTSPIAENGPYQPESYLHPTSIGPTTSTPNHKAGNQSNIKDQYLTPLSISEDTDSVSGYNNDVRPKEVHPPHKFIKNQSVSPKVTKTSRNVNLDQTVPAPAKSRFRRLRSVSCEDLSDYLRNVVYDPVSKSMNDLLDDHNDDGYITQEPFPRLQSFSGVIERGGDHELDNYYNIEGLKGKIYDGPGLTVTEIRKRFSKKSQSRIRRSVSNPSFIGSLSVEKLNMARMSIGLMHAKEVDHRSSIKDVLPEALKRHLNKESHHKGSHGALSSGAASSRNSSKHSSRGSSRTSSAQTSPYNSLSRKGKNLNKEDIVATTSVKGINVTKRSRSFRRQKATDSEPVKDVENGQSENQSAYTFMGGHSMQPAENKGDNQFYERRISSEQMTEMNARVQELHESKSPTTEPKDLNGKKGPRVFKKPVLAQKPTVVLDSNSKGQSETTTV